MKRTFLGALLLCLAGIILPAKAAIVDSGTCGTNLTWTLTDDGTLTISGTGEMYGYNGGAPWFSNSINIKTVMIEQGVTSVGDYAFFDCCSLTSVTIPEGVTSIGDNAFWSCSNLATITIPESVTSIGGNAFGNCGSLTSIIIPESVTSIGEEGFKDCIGLNSVTLPERMTSIGNSAFEGCSSLTSVTIPESVTNIEGYTFSGCSSLTTVTIPEGVTSIGNSAFKACPNLTSITLPKSVTSIGQAAFNACGLTSITIPEGVTSIGNGAFHSCPNLTTVTLPKSVTSIGNYVFSACSKLTEIIVKAVTPPVICEDFPKYNIQVFVPEEAMMNYLKADGWKDLNLRTKNHIAIGTYGDNLIWSITNNGMLNISGIGEMNYYAFSAPWLNHRNYIKTVVIEQGVTSIGALAFQFCSNQTSITLPESVKSIGYGAFNGCGLTSITIPEGVTSIEYGTFFSCPNLTSVILPESVTSIGEQTFSDCSNLTSIILPKSVTSIGHQAFYNCSNLTSITLPESVTSIGSNAFSNCSSLTSVILPENVASIGNYVFSGCSGLTEIIVKAVTPPVVGADAFFGVNAPVYVPEEAMISYLKADGWRDINLLTEKYFTIGLCGSNLCWGLTDNGTLNINGNGKMDDYNTYSNPIPWSTYRNSLLTMQIEQGMTNIGNYAFSGCRNLASVTLPESLTSIGSGAFYDCSGLTTVNLPENVTNIGYYAFSGCLGLTQMTVSATTPPAVGIGVFNGVSRSIPVHVPAESLTAYQNADVWKEFNLQAMASTGLGSVTALEQSIEVCNGEIILNRTDRPLVSLYDLGGRLVHQSHDCRIAVPHPGTYILRVGQEAVKVMMR